LISFKLNMSEVETKKYISFNLDQSSSIVLSLKSVWKSTNPIKNVEIELLLFESFPMVCSAKNVFKIFT